MSVEYQYLFYRTAFTSPLEMDEYYAQRCVLSSIEAFLAFRSSHSHLDGADVPVYDILVEGNPRAHKIYAFDSIGEITRPDEVTSPFIEGVRYPDDYSGGFCYDDETSLITISEVGEGTELSPQYWAFDYDEGLFDREGVYASRWHISGCSMVQDGCCRTSIQFTYYLTDASFVMEPPDSYHEKLMDWLLIPAGESYCRYGDNPLLDVPLALDGKNSDELEAKLGAVSATMKESFSAQFPGTKFIDGIPYEHATYMLNAVLGDKGVTGLVEHLYESRWALFESMMLDTSRTVPILLVCSDMDGYFPISYSYLFRDLIGMANVFYADLSDGYVSERLDKFFEQGRIASGYRHAPGRVRVYPGGIDIKQPADARSCPSFGEDDIRESPDPDTDSFAGFTSCPAVFDLVLSYQRLSSDIPIDVAGLAQKRALETADRYVRARNTLSLVDSSEAEALDGLVQEEAVALLEESRLEVALLTEELKKLSALYNGTLKRLSEKSAPDARIWGYYDLKEAQKRHRELIRELSDRQRLLSSLDNGLPETLEDVLDAIEGAYGDYVAVTSEAHDSAREYGRHGLNDAWGILRNIPALWRLHFEGGHDVEREFKALTGYELALTETGATKGNRRMMSSRELTYGEGKIDITPHIKGGTRDYPLRIHYGLDKEKRLIVIGHCGSHLPTSAGKK